MTHSDRPSGIVAIVIMFNSHEEVCRCVQTALDQVHSDLEVIVINNGSLDDSGTQVRARFHGSDRITVVDLLVNRGFSGGANVGFVHALERKSKFIWLLTDDIELSPNAASHLVGALQKDERIGLAGQYIMDRWHPATLYYGGGILAPNGAIHERRGDVLNIHVDQGGVRETEFVTGASMFWRAQALGEVGLMDESYWLYWEDADLSYRARMAGWKIAVVPNAMAWHDVTPVDDPSMPLRTRYSTRNELIFLKKFQLADTTRKARRTLIQGLCARMLYGNKLAGAAAMGALDHLLGRTGRIRGRW